MGGTESRPVDYQSAVKRFHEREIDALQATYDDLVRRSDDAAGLPASMFVQYFDIPESIRDAVLKAFDTSKDGKIQFEEFVCALAICCRGTVVQKMNFIFDVFNMAQHSDGLSRADVSLLVRVTYIGTEKLIQTVLAPPHDIIGGGRSVPDLVSLTPSLDALTSEMDALEIPLGGDEQEAAIAEIVEDAFTHVRAERMSRMEFVDWAKSSPRVLQYFKLLFAPSYVPSLRSRISATRLAAVVAGHGISAAVSPVSTPSISVLDSGAAAATTTATADTTTSSSSSSSSSSSASSSASSSRASHPNTAGPRVFMETPELSEIITPEILRAMAPYFPMNVDRFGLRQTYCTGAHGYSLETLYLRSERQGKGLSSNLLLVMDSGGSRFGAFCSESWTARYRTFGDSSCCLFKLEPNNEVKAFPVRVRNGLYQYCDKKLLAIGGGENDQHAIGLDAYFRNGTSHPRHTFGNPSLSTTPEFHVHRVEVWHFFDPKQEEEMRWLREQHEKRQQKSVLDSEDMYLLDLLGKSVSRNARDQP